MLDESIIKMVVERILAVARPDRIILFGSAAIDRMSPDSDIDLLVIAHGVENARSESVRLRAALGTLGYPIDVVVMATERFEESKTVIGGLAFPAWKYGKVIYEAA